VSVPKTSNDRERWDANGPICRRISIRMRLYRLRTTVKFGTITNVGRDGAVVGAESQHSQIFVPLIYSHSFDLEREKLANWQGNTYTGTNVFHGPATLRLDRTIRVTKFVDSQCLCPYRVTSIPRITKFGVVTPQLRHACSTNASRGFSATAKLLVQ